MLWSLSLRSRRYTQRIAVSHCKVVTACEHVALFMCSMAGVMRPSLQSRRRAVKPAGYAAECKCFAGHAGWESFASQGLVCLASASELLGPSECREPLHLEV